MTNKELNRDIKKMYKNCTSLKKTNLYFDGDFRKNLSACTMQIKNRKF